MDSNQVAQAGESGNASPAAESGRLGGGTVLLVGDVSEQQARTVRHGADMAGDDLYQESSVEGAFDWIERNGKRPNAIGLAMDREGSAHKAIELRENFALAGVPIIGLVRTLGDLAFEEAFASGIDEVCAFDEVLLGRRLRHLAEIDPASVVRNEATVVVADATRETRLLIGRVFRDAGYTVAFALDAEEALRQSLEPKTIAVIVSASLGVAGEELLAVRAAKAGCHAPWIINTPPKDMPTLMRMSLRAAMSGVNVTVHDAFAAPAALLFVANERLNKPERDGRRSERLLYGTALRFRLAGRASEDVGYLYNLSEGGMYARTLAPPARWEELWIEFQPPRSDRFVHLDATCVWVRKYGPSGTASVPPGFGVQVTGGSKADLGRYERSYRAFQEERQASRDSIHPIELQPG